MSKPGGPRLEARGVKVSEVFHAGTPGAQFQPDGASGRLSGPAPDHASYRSYVTFSDPDGNGWVLQEVTTRLPGRIGAAETTFTSSAELATALRRAAAAHGVRQSRARWVKVPHPTVNGGAAQIRPFALE